MFSSVGCHCIIFAVHLPISNDLEFFIATKSSSNLSPIWNFQKFVRSLIS